jgi:hypothetical protein
MAEKTPIACRRFGLFRDEIRIIASVDSLCFGQRSITRYGPALAGAPGYEPCWSPTIRTVFLLVGRCPLTKS